VLTLVSTAGIELTIALQSPRQEGIAMKHQLGAIIWLIFAACLVVAAQSDEPELLSANIPSYPPLARQARVHGIVKVSFTLPANSAEPTGVEAVSGHPILKPAAVENVKSWRFRNIYAVPRRYETTFHYTLSESEGRHVTFESFKVVDIVTPTPRPSIATSEGDQFSGYTEFVSFGK
jgi:hypothetical protein